MLSGLPCTDDACQGILLPANPLNLRSPSLCNSCSVKVSPQQRTKLQIARGAEMDKYGSAEPIEVAHYLAHSFLPTSQIDVQLKCSMILKLGHHEGFSLSGRLSENVSFPLYFVNHYFILKFEYRVILTKIHFFRRLERFEVLVAFRTQV